MEDALYVFSRATGELGHYRKSPISYLEWLIKLFDDNALADSQRRRIVVHLIAYAETAPEASQTPLWNNTVKLLKAAKESIEGLRDKSTMSNYSQQSLTDNTSTKEDLESDIIQTEFITAFRNAFRDLENFDHNQLHELGRIEYRLICDIGDMITVEPEAAKARIIRNLRTCLNEQPYAELKCKNYKKRLEAAGLDTYDSNIEEVEWAYQEIEAAIRGMLELLVEYFPNTFVESIASKYQNYKIEDLFNQYVTRYNAQQEEEWRKVRSQKDKSLSREETKSQKDKSNLIEEYYTFDNKSFLEAVNLLPSLDHLNPFLGEQLKLYAKRNGEGYEKDKAEFHSIYKARENWLKYTRFMCQTEYNRTNNQSFAEVVLWCEEWIQDYLHLSNPYSTEEQKKNHYLKPLWQELNELASVNPSEVGSNVATISQDKPILDQIPQQHPVQKATKKGKHDTVAQSIGFECYIKEDYRSKLIPFLIEHYKNKKPRDIAQMLYALEKLGAMTGKITKFNQTDLHCGLLQTFGFIGARNSLSIALQRYDLKEAGDEQKRQIEICRLQIESFMRANNIEN